MSEQIFHYTKLQELRNKAFESGDLEMAHALIAIEMSIVVSENDHFKEFLRQRNRILEMKREIEILRRKSQELGDSLSKLNTFIENTYGY